MTERFARFARQATRTGTLPATIEIESALEIYLEDTFKHLDDGTVILAIS